jgi:hypothetical protein
MPAKEVQSLEKNPLEHNGTASPSSKTANQNFKRLISKVMGVYEPNIYRGL